MSRIGRLPITVPAGVTVTVNSDNLVTVKGPKGTLTQQVNPAITVNQEGNIVTLTRPSDAAPHRAMHGLYRTLVNNMVIGVSTGFQKTLEWSVPATAPSARTARIWSSRSASATTWFVWLPKT